MPLVLRVAELLEHSHLAIGRHERLAALLHFRGDRLPLLIGRLPLDLENHFVARAVGQSIDVHGPGTRSVERPALGVGQLAIDLGDAIKDQLLRLLGLRQMRAALVAPRLAKPQQCGQSKLETRHRDKLKCSRTSPRLGFMR